MSAIIGLETYSHPKGDSTIKGQNEKKYYTTKKDFRNTGDFELMARKKTNNPRNKHIDVRLTEEEFNHFKFKAASTGLTASKYIRNIGMSYPLKSMVDQLAVDELIKVRADFGRVGGLFKKWLVAQEGRTGSLGSRSYEDINKIVEELELKKIEILQIAQKIMNNTKGK